MMIAYPEEPGAQILRNYAQSIDDPSAGVGT
jgi:hypothetical protein